MRLIIKNLKGNQFDVEVDPSSTVAQLKQQIEEEQKIEANTQKLVAIGKVMDDAKTVADYNLKEGDFIVVMITKPKKEKAKPTPAPQPAPTPVATSTTAPAPVPSSATAPAPVPSHTSMPHPSAGLGSGSSSGSGGDAGILRGEALENTLREMQDMGFAKEECMRALRAAYYNPDRAVDYLLNGIPPGAEEQPRSRAPPNVPSQDMEGDDEEDDLPGGGYSPGNPLAFLQNNPMFEQLRQRLISDPGFFQTFMSQLATTQPQLHQAISSNPQAFLQLLLGGGSGGAGGDMGPDNDPPGTIRVTQEEKDAIERLAALGFPKHRAIEAYFACDKNEEWAANYLFENGMVDDNYENQLAEDESRADVEGDAALGMGGAPANVPASHPPAAANPPPAQQNPPSNENMDVDQPANQDSNNDQPPEGGNNDEEDGSSL